MMRTDAIVLLSLALTACQHFEPLRCEMCHSLHCEDAAAKVAVAEATAKANADALIAHADDMIAKAETARKAAEAAQHKAEVAQKLAEDALGAEKYRACAPFCVKEKVIAKPMKPSRGGK